MVKVSTLQDGHKYLTEKSCLRIIDFTNLMSLPEAKKKDLKGCLYTLVRGEDGVDRKIEVKKLWEFMMEINKGV